MHCTMYVLQIYPWILLCLYVKSTADVLVVYMLIKSCDHHMCIVYSMLIQLNIKFFCETAKFVGSVEDWQGLK